MDQWGQGVRGAIHHPPPLLFNQKGRKNGTFLWEILPLLKSDSGPHTNFSEGKGGQIFFFSREFIKSQISDWGQGGPKLFLKKQIVKLAFLT